MESGAGVTAGADVRNSVGLGAAVCCALLLLELELDLEFGAGAATMAVDNVVGCARLEEVEVTGGEVLIAGGGGAALETVDDKAAAVVVDVNDCEVVASPRFGAVVAKGAEVVDSSSESSSSLRLSTPESRSSPSAASSVDPRPVGRATLVMIAGVNLSGVACAELTLVFDETPNLSAVA